MHQSFRVDYRRYAAKDRYVKPIVLCVLLIMCLGFVNHLLP